MKNSILFIFAVSISFAFGCSLIWKQCGGQGWLESTCCQIDKQPTSCIYADKWYSHCLPTYKLLPVPSPSPVPSPVSNCQISSIFQGNNRICANINNDNYFLTSKNWTSIYDFTQSVKMNWDSQFLSVSNGILNISYSKGYGPNAGGSTSPAFPNAPYTGMKRMTLQYEVFFPLNFEFVIEGKLLGITGSEDQSSYLSCSGGQKADFLKCFSVRGLWRSSNGAGALYIYSGDSQPPYCASPSICDSNWGDIVGRQFNYKKDEWNKIRIDVDAENGIVAHYLDNNLMTSWSGVKFYTKKFQSIVIESFFGGGSESFASPKSQYILVKNIQLSGTDNPVYFM